MQNLRYLLEEDAVRREIDLYKWLESEKKGYDIGYNLASESWLNLFGENWVKQHPRQVKNNETENEPRKVTRDAEETSQGRYNPNPTATQTTRQDRTDTFEEQKRNRNKAA